MRILLVGFTKIKFMPYMQFYFDNLNMSENEVSLLYWNRDLIKEDTSKLDNIKLYEFRFLQKDDVNKILKIRSFIHFRNYAKKVISKGKFDYIIVVHSLPALLISDLLKKKFRKKYIFDYRDSTFESITWFKRKIQKIQENAAYTFVSSDDYREFFLKKEQHNILTSHNIILDSLTHRKDREQFGLASDKIRISFWGFIRHKDINTLLIDRIGNDNRFELHYYGREQEVAHALKKHVELKKYSNVFFHGEYAPNDRYEFIKNTDILDNIYIDDDNLRRAMGNKYYDGIVFRIPQICNVGGCIMGRLVTKNGLGLECDPRKPSFCDEIYNYYRKLDWDQFYQSCDKELERILAEYQTLKEVVMNVGK